MFISLGYMPRGRIAESSSNSMVSFLRNCPYVFVAHTWRWGKVMLRHASVSMDEGRDPD